jgi:hypothetical protein
VGPGEQPVEDFLFDQRRHGRDVLRPFEQAHQAQHGVEQLRRRLVHDHPARRMTGQGLGRQAHAREHLLQPRAVDRHAQAQHGLLRRGLDDARDHRQVHGHHQAVAGAVVVDLPAQAQALGALGDERKTRPLRGVHGQRGHALAGKKQLVDGGRRQAVGFGGSGNEGVDLAQAVVGLEHGDSSEDGEGGEGG